MTTLETCLNYLDSRGIRYAHTSHAPAYTAAEVAIAEYLPPHRMAKTVVFRGTEGHVLAVVPAGSYVDEEQLRIAVGISNLQKAREQELYLLFPNAELGSMPPLGVLFGLPVYLDRELARQEFIAFNAGTHRDLIHMKVSDFKRLIQPVIGDFGTPNYKYNEFIARA